MITTAAAGTVALLAVGCRSGGTTASGSQSPSPGSSPSASSGQTAGTSQSPQQAIALATQQASQVNSFAATLSMRQSGQQGETMSGTVEMRRQPSLLLETNFSHVDLGGRNLPGGMQAIATAKTVYLKMAQIQALTGKPWAAVSVAGLQGATGLNLGQLTQQVQNSDPMMDAQMLAAATNLRSLGTQTIDGVPATQYAGTFPAASGVVKLPSNLRGSEQLALRALGIKTIGLNVWVDAQHQIRKLVLSERGSVQMTETMQVTSYNQPVNVNLPPASQVKTLSASELAG